jgi:Prokaryotic cytochrome b561
MPPTSPYQPIPLRILHGAGAILALLALVTGFWIYNTYDQRWGSLFLPKLADIQGIHGTIAAIFLWLLPIFALYSFHVGHRRLLQPETMAQLSQIGYPVGWLALHRIANTLMLLSATFSIVTGAMMNEDWLPAGELNHFWYLSHLLAWLCLLISVALHLLLGAKIGGVPLLISIWSWHWRTEDRPNSWGLGLRLKPSSLLLWLIEGMVVGGIVLAFVLPLFKSLF